MTKYRLSLKAGILVSALLLSACVIHDYEDPYYPVSQKVIVHSRVIDAPRYRYVPPPTIEHRYYHERNMSGFKGQHPIDPPPRASGFGAQHPIETPPRPNGFGAQHPIEQAPRSGGFGSQTHVEQAPRTGGFVGSQHQSDNSSGFGSKAAKPTSGFGNQNTISDNSNERDFFE